MTVKNYLKKCAEICDYYKQKQECDYQQEKGIVNKCPLYAVECGLPPKKNILKCIAVVEGFEFPQSQDPIQGVVLCKDCANYCPEVPECNLHGGNLGEYGFCSKGRGKQ